MGCLLLSSSAAWLCALGLLPCCTCGCPPTVCWTKGFVAFLPVLRSSLLVFCRLLWVLFSHMVQTLRDGVTPAGSRLVCPRSERRFSVFSFPFGLFLRVVTALRDIVTIWVRCVGRFPLLRDRRLSWVLHPFSFWMGFEPLSEASLSAL